MQPSLKFETIKWWVSALESEGVGVIYLFSSKSVTNIHKRDDITQERLAEVIGVTNQAVSKWESGNSYPDIEYIPPIANLFNVTIDYLFDHDTAEKRKIIEEYCAQYDTHSRVKQSLYDERIELMRHALAEFPAEEKLLIKLAEVLFYKWLSNGLRYLTENGYTYPDVKWHKSLDSWEESMKIMEELLASSTDDAIRAKCRYYLSMITVEQAKKKNCWPSSKNSIQYVIRRKTYFTLPYSVKKA